MRFKNCTLGYVKKLYLEKVKAVENNDLKKIEYFKNNFPELFNANFLMDFLKNEFERSRKGLDDNMIFQTNLFKYH